MDLLDRYLQAVRFFLPRTGQDDIVRELSENIRSQMEDREEELGRPLTVDEQAEILKRHGHPMLVAGRYTRRQHLIGPAFFPTYLFALKVALAIMLAVSVVLGGILSLTTGNPLPHLVELFAELPIRALVVFGVVTLVFAALDLWQVHFGLSGKWDPRTLPKVIAPQVAIPRAHTISSLAFLWVFVVWWLLAMQNPWLLFGPAAALVKLAPIWRQLLTPIVLLAAAGMVLHMVNFIRPYLTQPRAIARLGLNALQLALVAILLSAPALVAPAWTARPEPHYAEVVRIVDVSIRLTLIGIGVTTIVESVRVIVRMIRLRRLGSGAALPT
jgi:hypothetical protein